MYMLSFSMIIPPVKSFEPNSKLYTFTHMYRQKLGGGKQVYRQYINDNYEVCFEIQNMTILYRVH